MVDPKKKTPSGSDWNPEAIERFKRENDAEMLKLAPAHEAPCRRCFAKIAAAATVCQWCGFGRVVPMSFATATGYVMLSLAALLCITHFVSSGSIDFTTIFVVAVPGAVFVACGWRSEAQDQELGRLRAGAAV